MVGFRVKGADVQGQMSHIWPLSEYAMRLGVTLGSCSSQMRLRRKVPGDFPDASSHKLIFLVYI